jgi:hypothetical protein
VVLQPSFFSLQMFGREWTLKIPVFMVSF